MRFFLVFSICCIASISATLLTKAALLNFSGLGDPCKVSDESCCHHKFTLLFPLIIKHLGTPLVIPKLKVGYGKGVLQLDQTLDNLKVEGLEKATVTSSKLDLVGGKLLLSLHIKELKLVTKYNINGRCLVVPIWGKGDGVITLKNVDVKLDVFIRLDNGKLLMNDMKSAIKAGGIHFKFSSLFGEIRRKILTPEFEKVFNDNAALVLHELIPEYETQLGKHFKVLLKPVLEQVPLEVLLLLPVLS